MLSSMSYLLTWTLIHSLWIAAAAMILARVGAAVVVKPHLKGKIRLFSLVAFLTTTSIFFLWKMELKPVGHYGIYLSEEASFEIIEASGIQQVERWISSNSQLISLVWLTGSIFSFIRYYVGFYQISRIKQFSQTCTHEAILAMVKKIKDQLSIRSKVEIRISSLINSPLTSGWLKPVIYLPIGMTTGFSIEEIDTILHHEMVHIKRRDYLVNLILASMETLFFFNPFVLVMIKDLRSDMEYACDDHVIEHNNKVTYVHALLKLQELRLSNSLGLAAKGNNSEFLKRINKMMNKTNNSNEKSKLIPGLIICLFLAASIMGSAFISKAEPKESVMHSSTDLIQSQDTIRAATLQELKQKLEGFDRAKIASTVFIADGKVVPVVSGENLEKGETMMNHIKKELVRDGILSEENKRVKLMFQYSDLLNGKEVLGDKYPKYKKIFNSYFPTYDSYATTRVFKFD